MLNRSLLSTATASSPEPRARTDPVPLRIAARSRSSLLNLDTEGNSMMRKTIVAALLAAAAVLGGSTLPGVGTPAAHAIIGGQTVTNNDLAFVAELHNATGSTCTGSLIHSSWVLTAAHCFRDASVGDISVRVGNTSAGTGGQLRRVTRLLRNPEWNGSGHHDVALYELSSPVSGITPVKLGTPSQAYLWDGAGGGFSQYDQGLATGWGQLGDPGAMPDRLQFVGVSIKPSSLDNLGIEQLNSTRGGCFGDSGGPLLVTANGAYVQAGVIRGGNCGQDTDYSEVGDGANRGWIMDQLTKLPYTSFGLADYDRDGYQDLIMRQDATGELWLYPGDGARGYSRFQRVRIGDGWNGYTAFGVADWDRDGHQDIITRQDSTGELWLYPGAGLRGYSPYQRVRIRTGMEGRTPFGVADWDRDGTQDLLYRDDASGGNLYLLPGNGARGSNGNATVFLSSGFNRNSSFDVTDWDRDGYQDLITRSNDRGILWLYRGDGRQAIGGASAVLGTGWQGYTSFGAADYDRDGHQDIVARQDRTTELWLYRGQSVRGMLTVPRVQIGHGL